MVSAYTTKHTKKTSPLVADKEKRAPIFFKDMHALLVQNLNGDYAAHKTLIGNATIPGATSIDLYPIYKTTS